jgi:YYY domain-containing protein
LRVKAIPPAFWLTLILLTSLALRLYNINWDEFQHAHPDERWITMVAVEIHLPKSFSEALNPRLSPLNPLYDPKAQAPRGFAYGHLPLYILTALAGFLSAIGKAFFPKSVLPLLSTYDYINLLGRVLSALFDTGTVYLIYRTGKLLYGERVGLWAAAFVSLTVSHIQLAHYYAFDPVATFFIVLSVYFSAKLTRSSGRIDAFLAGAAAGLAISSKFSALPVLAAVALACWLSPRKGARLKLLALSALAAFLAFAITSPFALLDLKSYLVRIGEQGQMVRGKLDYPYTRQYRGTTPFVYHIEQQLRWGMGWALGIVAFTGLAWATVRLLRRKSPPGEAVILAWVLPYFIINGSFMVKFMRYLLPIVPFLILFGALLLESLSEKVRRLPLGLIVLIPTALWALAFVHGVYGHTHTWVEASRWIYQNIPPGSAIAVEHWDDELPKPLKGEPYPGYRHLVLPLYEEDTAEKFAIVKETLRQADYIVIASNRLYRSIPRLPYRYPMTIRYYELLFAGKLGFEKVAEFSSYPRLGPWVIPDDEADESFTVYDHPKPMVFKKVRDLTDEEWEKLLGGFWEEAIPWHLGEPVGKLLLSTPVDRLPVVDDFRWNWLASSNPIWAALTWWMVLEIIGLAAWPLVFALLRRVHLRGYPFAKSFGLALLAYLNWLGASLRFTQNRATTIASLLLAMFALSLWVFWKNRREFWEFCRENRRQILLSELIFLAGYLAFVFLRLLNPDLWHPWNGGEKPMELAFLNAILKSAYFPPYDPYYAGGYINYYYYGLYLVSVLAKLTGITPTVAFNLAIPSLFALTFTGAFALGATIGGRLSSGLLSACFVALMGNLATFRQLLEELAKGNFRQAFVAFDYWAPSRVIPYTINEFPYWSFLFADLHPHVVAMPFDLLFLALVLEAFLGGVEGWRRKELTLAQALILGTLAATNTWNFPTASAIAILALLISIYRQRKGWENLLLAFALPSLAFVLSSPFFLSYKPMSAGIGIVRQPTPWVAFATFWGFFILASILAGFNSLLSRKLSGQEGLIVFLGLIAAILAFKRLWVPLTILVAVAPFILELLNREKPLPEAFSSLLTLAGFLVVMGCEFFYFKDFLQGSEYYRMNTVFKFYVQAWVLLGLGLAYPFQAFIEARGKLVEAAKGLALILMALSFLFPISGTVARVRDRFPNASPPIGTLDGMEFMRYGSYFWPDEAYPIDLRYDYEAIRWLMDNVRGTPVLAEAPIGYYREFGVRVSSFTGLPTLLGMHQSEQRYGEQVGKRSEEANLFFSSTDLGLTLKLVRKLRIGYIYIGQLERILFPAESLAKFEKLADEGWLEEVFRNERTVIYRTFLVAQP